MSLKLINYSITLSILKIDIGIEEQLSLQWKLDSGIYNIPITNQSTNKQIRTQSNFIVDQQKRHEDKISQLLILKEKNIQKQHNINLSQFLNLKLMQAHDELEMNDGKKILIQWNFEKLYGINLGHKEEKQQVNSPQSTEKSEELPKKLINNNEQKLKIQLVEEKKYVEETSQTMVKLIAENKKLKAQITEFKRQIESLQQQKPIVIQQELEGYLRDYQMENEKLRKLLKDSVQENKILTTQINQVHQQFFQNTEKFQAYIQYLENQLQEVIIGCNNYQFQLDIFEKKQQFFTQKIQDYDNQEENRKLEVSKLLKGKLIYSTSECQNNISINTSNHTTENYQAKDICQFLENDS